MKKVIAITGSRAEYGLAYPIFKALNAQRGISFSLIITGMHLSPEFGNSFKEVEKDGFEIEAKIKSLFLEDTGTAMAQSVGKSILGITEVLRRTNPDFLLVLADLGWALAGAIAGIYMNIPIVHLHGGEVSGNVDDSIRHSITKLSHIHFTSTKKSAKRIIKMGEAPWRVYVVGAPGLDSILHQRFVSPKILAKNFHLNLEKPLLLVIQHSVTTEPKKAGKQMAETMEAIKGLKEQTIVIYPNSDAGGQTIIKVIEKHRRYPFIQIHKNLPHKVYLSLMKISSVMIGNSSSGIIEAPSFHLPVVNIGNRQEGRERAENVVDVGYNRSTITKAIKKALYDKKFLEKVKRCKNPYGDGKTGPRVAKILSELEITPKLLQKKITY